ncbi:MAG: AraC family transcriptional regulator [Dokdonella sp.]
MPAAEKALWYIESHYSTDIALADIARIAGVSPFHLARLFQTATGWSVVRYLRARRLTEAARLLAGGAPDILDLALNSGYASHEAFTRAFREQFGVTPDDLRQRGSVADVALVEPLRSADEQPVALETPRIERSTTQLIAGLGRRYNGATTQGIPAQWQRLVLSLNGFSSAGKTAFGVFCNSDDEGSFEYIAGYDVSSFSGLNASWSTIRLPERNYAVATHRGHISSIRRTWQTFTEHWLPQSGLEVADAPDFERYSANFDDSTGMGDVEIWIPLKS